MAKIDEEIIRAISTNKTELQDKFNIESLSVFGSVSKGEETTASDIDILVRYRKVPGFFAFLDLKRYLEDLTGRPVDLVTENGLKRQLKEKILQEAIRVT
ncbi:MAG: nucleotidyltransferase family protein [Bacteroidetes bacterium]|nr:nucleotidyltransferase family protein [Bacteroidota bacterium]